MIHENENVQFRRSRLSGGLYVLKLQLRSQWAYLQLTDRVFFVSLGLYLWHTDTPGPVQNH